jgi:hypothetical protein
MKKAFVILFLTAISLVSAYNLDGDPVPDHLDKCLDTSLGDPVDINPSSEHYGCSCEQGAKYVTLEGHNEPTSCEKLMAEPGFIDRLIELIRGGPPCSPRHCCNGIKDKGEILVDCGVNAGCPPCTGLCVRIGPETGSTYDILLVPIGYSSSLDPNVPHNFHSWVARAEKELSDLQRTPPFDHANVWRLDLFREDPDFIDQMLIYIPDSFENRNKLVELNARKIQLVNSKLKDYRFFCPEAGGNNGIDTIVFAGTNFPNSIAQKGFKDYVVIKDEMSNAISHELGHAFCKLEDEYASNLMHTELSAGNPPNCDVEPEVCQVDGNNQIIPGTCTRILHSSECDEPGVRCVCKWQPEHSQHALFNKFWLDTFGNTNSVYPDGGCVAECAHNTKFRRPTFNNPSSIMSREGHFQWGIHAWNEISYNACTSIMRRYTDAEFPPYR